MNKIEKGKHNLVSLSVIISLLSSVLTILSLTLLISGINHLGESLVTGIILIVVGSLLTLTFLLGIVIGLIMLFTGKALVATKGSLKEDNIALNGTVNMKKCNNCGSELNKEEFCPNCGKSQNSLVKCPKCKAKVSADAKHCPKCGEQL